MKNINGENNVKLNTSIASDEYSKANSYDRIILEWFNRRLLDSEHVQLSVIELQHFFNQAHESGRLRERTLRSSMFNFK